jgi:putative hydrolase of the HAD superfamily
MRVDALVFDLDNTLLDRTKTFKKFTERFVDYYFANGLESERREIIDFIINIDNDGYKNKNEMFRELVDELTWVHKPDVNELMDFYNTHYIECAEIMEATIELLIYSKEKGYKTGLITNGKNHIQYGKIHKLGLSDYFDVIIVSEEAGVKKPDERIFKQALNQLEVEPQNSIFVGDHPINDILGASRVGFNTVWIKRNQPWDESIEIKPLKTIENLKQMITFLDRASSIR